MNRINLGMIAVLWGCGPVSDPSPLTMDRVSPPAMTLEGPAQVLRGSSATFHVQGAPAGARVALVATTGGLGTGLCPTAWSGACLSIVGQPKRLATQRAGVGTLVFDVGLGAGAGMPTRFVQAVALDPGGVVLSDPLTVELVSAPSFVSVTHPTEVTRMDRLDIAFTLDQTFDNPYDPRQVRAWAVIDTPDATQQVPAFWWEGYTTDGVSGDYLPTGDQGWRVRMMPELTGEHTVTLHVETPTGSRVSAPSTFDVVARTSPAPSYLLAPTESRGFQHEADPEHDVKLFGFNMPHRPDWSPRGVVDRFQVLVDEVGAAGGQGSAVQPFASIKDMVGFLASERCDLDVTCPDSVTEARYRQETLAALDDLFALAEEADWKLLYHLWDGNFFRGFTANQEAFRAHAVYGNRGERYFWSDADFRRLQRQRLRYVVARYGYSPALFAWSLVDEGNFDSCDGEDCVPCVDADCAAVTWHEEMVPHLRALDPLASAGRRSITSNMKGIPHDPQGVISPALYDALYRDLDFVRDHTYGFYDHRARIARIADGFACRDGYTLCDKPLILTEYGNDNMTLWGSVASQGVSCPDRGLFDTRGGTQYDLDCAWRSNQQGHWAAMALGLEGMSPWSFLSIVPTSEQWRYARDEVAWQNSSADGWLLDPVVETDRYALSVWSDAITPHRAVGQMAAWPSGRWLPANVSLSSSGGVGGPVEDYFIPTTTRRKDDSPLTRRDASGELLPEHFEVMPDGRVVPLDLVNGDPWALQPLLTGYRVWSCDAGVRDLKHAHPTFRVHTEGPSALRVHAFDVGGLAHGAAWPPGYTFDVFARVGEPGQPTVLHSLGGIDPSAFTSPVLTLDLPTPGTWDVTVWAVSPRECDVGAAPGGTFVGPPFVRTHFELTDYFQPTGTLPAATVDGQVHEDGRAAMVYIQSRKSNLLHFAHGADPENEQHGLTLYVEGLVDGDYTVQWHETEEGTLIHEEVVTVSGVMDVSVPSFSHSISALMRNSSSGGNR